MPVERPAQDLPLLGVGVLELVDEDDGEARTHPPAGGVAVLRIAENGVQQGQLVVEVAQAEAALASFDLFADRTCELHTLAGRGAVGVVRCEFGLRVEDRLLRGDGRLA